MEIVPGRYVGESLPCFIIAEIGQNHQGDIEIAKRLIKAAKECGADCVKFQKSDLSEKFNAAALARLYTGPNSWGRTYGEHKSFLEFSEAEFKELQEYAKQMNIHFTASAMDTVSVDVLDSMEVPFIKIGSGDANNLPLIKYAATKKRPLVISTGMQEMETVRSIYSLLKEENIPFCLMHCVSAYPVPPEEVNLRVIQTFKSEFPDIPIGYSGHEEGIAISIAAVALGAQVLERHITLDKSWKGSDHICSLTPYEFKELVDQVHIVELALGQPVKRFQPSEKPCFDKLAKTLVAARYLPANHCLTAEDIKIKVAEPKGCPAHKLKDIVGMKLTKSLNEDESIILANLLTL